MTEAAQPPRFNLAAQVERLGADSLLPPPKLTRSQIEGLRRIHNGQNPYGGVRSNAGGARARMMERLRRLKYWRYGLDDDEPAFVLTDAGRAALAKARGEIEARAEGGPG